MASVSNDRLDSALPSKRKKEEELRICKPNHFLAHLATLSEEKQKERNKESEDPHQHEDHAILGESGFLIDRLGFSGLASLIQQVKLPSSLATLGEKLINLGRDFPLVLHKRATRFQVQRDLGGYNPLLSPCQYQQPL